MTDGIDIEALMDAVKKKLEDDAYFDGVGVLTENDGDIEKTVRENIAKLGVCVEIGDVAALDKYPNITVPVWDPISFTVVISESVIMNRADMAHKTAMLVANKTADVLKGTLPGFGWVSTKSIRRLFKNKTLLMYEVEFQIGK